MKTYSSILFLLLIFQLQGNAQSEFYSMQPLGHRYIYNSDYYNEAREIQVYRNGVKAILDSDSILTIYVFDAQYPPTFNLFCSTFELLYPSIPCIIVGISNPNRQHELTPPYTDSNSVKGYENPGGADSLLLSLENEIIPFIKQKYSVSSKNILVGHSLGGTFVTYALLKDPNLFRCIISISPNYVYSNKMMIDEINAFAKEYKGDNKLYAYFAHGRKDKIEESFAPTINEAMHLLSEKEYITTSIDSLNIEKHSHTIFEGYYRGLLKCNGFITANK